MIRTGKFEQAACRFLPALLLGLALAMAPAPAWPRQSAAVAVSSATIRGTVKSGNIPLPGVTISASNSLTGAKVITSTDTSGAYSLRVPARGRYVVRADLSGFAFQTSEVKFPLPGNSPGAAKVDFELILESRAELAEQQRQRQAAAGNNSFQRLSVTASAGGLAGGESGAEGGEGNPSLPIPGLGQDTATESVSVSGATSAAQTGPLSSDAVRERIQELRDQQGAGGSAASGLYGRGGGPYWLAARGPGFDNNKPHGTAYYSLGDSSLDAAPYSLTGQNLAKPSFLQQNFGVLLGGPLNIPKIYEGGKKTFFFLNYNGSHASNPYTAFSTVPTSNERSGDFSGVTNGAGQPVVIYDPATGLPFPDNAIPSSRINPVAKNLLPYLPLPNLPGTFQNFQFIEAPTTSSDAINFRLIHTFGGGTFGFGKPGPRNNLNIGFRFQHSNNQITDPYPSVGGHTSVLSFDVPVAYIRTLGSVTNILRFEFDRNRISTQNLYAGLNNVAGNAGVGGVSSNPFDYGIPSLSFSNFTSLADQNPLLERDQTFTFSDIMIHVKGKHRLRWGGDFRRIQVNTQTDSASRGAFTFTGYNTSQFTGGVQVPGTGFDFADFLLGLPQLTSVQFGNNSYHFRANSWDLFVQDEWRVRSNLTFNLGLRYEYVSPFSETNNEIVNLDPAPGFTAIAPVLPGQVGPYGGRYPFTLVNPDRNNFAPRLGIAWKAFSNTVVRAGYGVNYLTTAYQNIAEQLAFQPPFSVTSTNIESPTNALTLANGFPPLPPGTITNSYGINKNYRLGYVQIWNLDIQQQIRPTLLLNVDYTGTKGTGLEILEDPNRTPTGLLIPNAQPFNYQNSIGDSILHAGTLRLRKRLANGISLGGSYTFSKSIDNASSIGGGLAVVAQNPLDLAAERGLSSFDQRQRFTGDWLWELPFGNDRRWLREKGPARILFGNWQWSGDWTIASGLPFTANVLGNSSEIVRGTNGTLRANVTGQPVAISNPTTAEWFNTAAFILPAAGAYGDAGRNTIIGPGTEVFDMAMTRVIPLGETRLLEFRGEATNVFNHPLFTSIDTVVNSPTFGRVVGTGAMRAITLTARIRF